MTEIETEDEILARKRRELWEKLTEVAKLLPGLMAEQAETAKELKGLEDEYKRKVKLWDLALTSRRDKLRAIRNRIEHAAVAENRLRCEFVDRELVERASQADTKVNTVKAHRDRAERDVEACRIKIQFCLKPTPSSVGGKLIPKPVNREEAKHYEKKLAGYEATLADWDRELKKAKDALTKVEAERDAAYRKVLRGEF